MTRPWLVLTDSGQSCTLTYLTDEKALELLEADIRIRPLGGTAALVEQLREGPSTLD